MSLANVEHLFQCELNEGLVRFDHGDEALNRRAHGDRRSPYSFENLTAPSTWLLFGAADNLVGPERFGVRPLFPAASLRDVAVLDGLGHGDFVWSDLARPVVYARVLAALGLEPGISASSDAAPVPAT